MAQLDHPNVVPVHSLVMVADGRVSFTMKLVEGETLHDRVQAAGNSLDEPEALGRLLEVFLKVCDAVAFAHSRGICHCDIKPENIMVGSFGRVYLMDWGIASAIGGSDSEGQRPSGPERQTRPTIRGTPAYMSPEQASGQPELIGERTDVFGLGAVLYFIVVGTPPFSGRTTAESLQRSRRGDPIAPDRLALAPAGLQHIIKKAMSKNPQDRHASASELRRDVQSVLQGAWHLPIRTFVPGAPIVVEGESGDCAFVILSGQCLVTKSVAGRRRLLRRLGPGEVFGETAVLAGKKRTASVEAIDQVVVRVVTAESLQGQLGVGTDLGRFVVALAKRFCQMDARLSELEALLRKRRKRGRPGARKRATSGSLRH
jgi:serine/threonine-protein kinase